MTKSINNVFFFGAGRAKFVVHNNSGEKYIFKINGKEGEWTNPRTGKTLKTKTFFVSVCQGVDTWNNYSYVGLYNPKDFSVKFTNKSISDEKVRKIIVWAINMVRDNKELPKGYGILHVGKCCVCAKKLTDPESIEYGIGPECRKNRPEYMEKYLVIKEVLKGIE